MASPFEAFIQLELPLRPFAPIDGGQESIPVRRGAGPRQLTFIDLAEGEILGKVGGELKGVSVSAVGARRYQHTQNDAADVWIVDHNLSSVGCIAQVFDANSSQILPHKLETISPNQIKVTFNTPITGLVNVLA